MKLLISIFAFLITFSSYCCFHPNLDRVKIDHATPIVQNTNYKTKNEHLVTFSVQSPFKHDGSRIFVEKRTPIQSSLMCRFSKNNGQPKRAIYTICSNDVQTNSYSRFDFQFTQDEAKTLFETMENNY